VNELQRRGLKLPVLIGGAAINRKFGRRILRTEDGSVYEPGVFYCKDAFEGLSTMDALSVPETRQQLLSQIQQESSTELDGITQKVETVESGKSAVAQAEKIPHVPAWGAHVVKEMPLEFVFQHLAKNELFRLSWGAKNAHGAEWEKLKQEYEERLAMMEKQAQSEQWLKPQGIYGFWPAQSVRDDLIIYKPESLDSSVPEELTRFHFPRQGGSDALCLADYFASQSSGIMDVVVFQVVTVGKAATERFDRLQAAGNYSEAYFTHGLAVQTAEATAEFLHQHVRRELGLAENQGKRYSWGYPAIPDVADHAKVFQLLPAEKELGMHLTSAFQLVPEQSTAAIILHHPQAKYFNIGESRVDQLMKE